MTALFSALIAVFGLILLGQVLQRTAFTNDAFWHIAERLIYFLALPALLVSNLSAAPLEALDLGRMAVALVIPVTLVTILLLAWQARYDTFTGPAFTSVFQGGIRLNTYIGLATAGALFGSDGLAMAAVSLAVLIPLVNIFSVLALLRHTGSASRTGAKLLIMQILRNPLVLACLLGIGLNMLDVGLFPPLHTLLDALGQAALPLGLMAVGAGLQIARLGQHARPALLSSGIKLILLPMLSVPVIVALGLTPVAAIGVVLFAALPTSASSYILARQLGGDAQLMASILSLQTLLSAVTLPVILWLALHLPTA